MFESADPETRTINATDKRFFWLALYAQPALWILLGVVAIIKLISFVEMTPLWLTLVGESIYFALEDVYNCGFLTKGRSHCTHSHHHKHGCLLEMRQVQSGHESGIQRVRIGQPCTEHGWWFA